MPLKTPSNVALTTARDGAFTTTCMAHIAWPPVIQQRTKNHGTTPDTALRWLYHGAQHPKHCTRERTQHPGWHCPSPGITATPQGEAQRVVERGSIQTCSNRHHRSLPETPANATLAPGERPRRAGGAAAAAGSTPGPAARSSMSAAWQHNREQVTSAPAVALLQEASTQASDAAAPPETHT